MVSEHRSMAPKPADPERVTTVEKGLAVVQEATSRRSVKTWLGLRGELGKVRTQLEDVHAALWRMEALLAARPMAGEAEWGRDGKRRDGERRDRVPRGEESPNRDHPGGVEVPNRADLRPKAPIREDQGREREFRRRRDVGLMDECEIRRDLGLGGPDLQREGLFDDGRRADGGRDRRERAVELVRRRESEWEPELEEEKLAPGLGWHGYPRNREPIPVPVAVGADSGPIWTEPRDSGVKGADPGATETDPSATEAGLDDLAAVWIGPHDSGVKGVDSGVLGASSVAMKAGICNSDAIKINSGDLGAGSLVGRAGTWNPSVMRDDFGAIRIGCWNSSVIGADFRAIGADFRAIGAGLRDYGAIRAYSGEPRAGFLKSGVIWVGSDAVKAGLHTSNVIKDNSSDIWTGSSYFGPIGVGSTKSGVAEGGLKGIGVIGIGRKWRHTAAIT